MMFAKLSAEFLGTFWLVLCGCGSGVLAAAFPQVGIGLLGVSLAFGLTVLTAALICEAVMTMMFLLDILGSTHQRAPVGFAGIAIGLALTLIHQISMPVTNTSANPARSTGPALFVGGWALQQLWLFWIAPMVGAAVAGFVYRAVFETEPPEVPVTGR
jgi:aquaporin Z